MSIRKIVIAAIAILIALPMPEASEATPVTILGVLENGTLAGEDYSLEEGASGWVTADDSSGMFWGESTVFGWNDDPLQTPSRATHYGAPGGSGFCLDTYLCGELPVAEPATMFFVGAGLMVLGGLVNNDRKSLP